MHHSIQLKIVELGGCDIGLVIGYVQIGSFSGSVLKIRVPSSGIFSFFCGCKCPFTQTFPCNVSSTHPNPALQNWDYELCIGLAIMKSIM
jgi:hypothetical protein